MRRISRLRQPSAVLTQCLQTSTPSSQHAAVSRAAATSCLARPREFSTTPSRPFRGSPSWMDKVKTEGAIEEQKAEGVEPKESEPANEVEKHDILSVRQEESEVGIETDLVLPARDVTIAPRIEELDSDVENYRPADDASALEVVTGLQDWFSKDEHWGASKRFVGFAPTNKVTDPALLELHTRRAVLEAVAVTQAGDRQLLVRSWGAGGSKEDAIRTLGLGVEIEEEGAVKLVGDVKGVVEGLKNTEGVSPTSETIEPAEAKEIVQVCDQNWKEISLQDVQLKFAAAKRILQLTGHQISDAKLLPVKTAGHLVSIIVKPPPARKVFEAIQKRGELTKLPNVEVHETRRTPIHAAEKVGRWKVIKEELEKRGLPVTGNGGVDKIREQEWYRGPRVTKADKKKKR